MNSNINLRWKRKKKMIQSTKCLSQLDAFTNRYSLRASSTWISVRFLFGFISIPSVFFSRLIGWLLLGGSGSGSGNNTNIGIAKNEYLYFDVVSALILIYCPNVEQQRLEKKTCFICILCVPSNIEAGIEGWRENKNFALALYEPHVSQQYPLLKRMENPSVNLPKAINSGSMRSRSSRTR